MARAEQATADKLEASRRVVRRTVGGIIASLLLTALAGGLWLYARSQQRRAETNAAEARKETERADKFINLVSSNPAGLRVMEKTCLESIEITSKLATTSDKGEHKRSSDRFWELYYGPMYIVEIHQAKKSGLGYSKIEQSMVVFGRAFQDVEKTGTPLPHSSLCQLADAVRDECIAYLNVVAPRACP